MAGTGSRNDQVKGSAVPKTQRTGRGQEGLTSGRSENRKRQEMVGLRMTELQRRKLELLASENNYRSAQEYILAYLEPAFESIKLTDAGRPAGVGAA